MTCKANVSGDIALKDNLLFTVLKSWGHTTLHKSTGENRAWQQTERWEHWARPLLWFMWERIHDTKEMGLQLGSWSNFSSFEATRLSLVIWELVWGDKSRQGMGSGLFGMYIQKHMSKQINCLLSLGTGQSWERYLSRSASPQSTGRRKIRKKRTNK